MPCSGGRKSILQCPQVASSQWKERNKQIFYQYVVERSMGYQAWSDYRIYKISQVSIALDWSRLYRPARLSRERDIAIHSMDVLYGLSKYPMALLTVEIQSEDELSLRADVLEGKFVDQSEKGRQRLDLVKSNKARKAFELLNRITSDEWWMRGWTFQEDYRASVKMKLLVRHGARISTMKKSARMTYLFGGLDNELCFNSTTFREETTRFYRAFEQTCSQQQWHICKRIVERAAKYTVTLRNDSRSSDGPIFMPMSPTIFADISVRRMKTDEDILAIAANCCSYQLRLGTRSLQHNTQSLSIAILALCLLNGEIMLENGRTQKTKRLRELSSAEPWPISWKGIPCVSPSRAWRTNWSSWKAVGFPMSDFEMMVF